MVSIWCEQLLAGGPTGEARKTANVVTNTTPATVWLRREA